VILAEAFREAEKIKGEGDAKASQIYAEAFGKNPGVLQVLPLARSLPRQLQGAWRRDGDRFEFGVLQVLPSRRAAAPENAARGVKSKVDSCPYSDSGDAAEILGPPFRSIPLVRATRQLPVFHPHPPPFPFSGKIADSALTSSCTSAPCCFILTIPIAVAHAELAFA
jgi:hypothetical protein